MAPTPRRPPRRRAALWLVSLLLIPAGLLALGAAYQSAAAANARRTLPPPGQLVDLGGYRLHLNCTGRAAPGQSTVILEGGLGASALVWTLVQPGLAAHTRVCSYDRAGMGWSDASPQARTAAPLMAELHALLAQAGEAPPYVLVGHAYGGVLGRVFAARYPDEVAGLVLVDARHEDFFERMPAAYLQADQDNLRRARWLRLSTPFGLTRLAGQLGQLGAFERLYAPLPEQAARAAWELGVYSPPHWAATVAEREASPESYALVRTTALPAHLPIIVLTAEHGSEAWQTGTPDTAAEAIWLDLQAQLAALSDNSQWLTVAGSGHYIYFDQPAAVVDAALSLAAP